LGVRKVYEAEQDGNSVIVWESGSGTRIIYFNEQQAETAASYLISRANQFHTARELNDGSENESMVSIICYGDVPMTEFAFVQDYINRMRRAGYEIRTGLERSTKEFW
jgi:hypothetical protein